MSAGQGKLKAKSSCQIKCTRVVICRDLDYFVGMLMRFVGFLLGVPIRFVSGINDLTLELPQGDAFQAFGKALKEANQGLSIWQLLQKLLNQYACTWANDKKSNMFVLKRCETLYFSVNDPALYRFFCLVVVAYCTYPNWKLFLAASPLRNLATTILDHIRYMLSNRLQLATNSYCTLAL